MATGPGDASRETATGSAMLLRRLRIQASLRQVAVQRSVWASPRLQRLSTTAAVAAGGGGRRRGSWRLVGGSVAAAATLAGAVSATGVLDPPPVVEMEPPELPTNMVELRCRALVPSHPLSPGPEPTPEPSPEPTPEPQPLPPCACAGSTTRKAGYSCACSASSSRAASSYAGSSRPSP